MSVRTERPCDAVFRPRVSPCPAGTVEELAGGRDILRAETIFLQWKEFANIAHDIGGKHVGPAQQHCRPDLREHDTADLLMQTILLFLVVGVIVFQHCHAEHRRSHAVGNDVDFSHLGGGEDMLYGNRYVLTSHHLERPVFRGSVETRTAAHVKHPYVAAVPA
jgi:hypothetical protein